MYIYPNLTRIFANSTVTVNGSKYNTGLPQVSASSNELTTILNIVIGILAAISVLFIVIGGLRYVLSDGDPQDASKAKNTIIYAVVGLIISIAAEAIVAFALNNINSNT